MKTVQRIKFLTTAAVASAACTLSACGGLDVPGAPEAQEDTAVQGNATPASSPQADDPAGDVVAIDGFEQVDDLAAIGESVAVRSGDKLAVGTVEQLKSGELEATTIPAECGVMSTSHLGFVIGCGDHVLTVSPSSPGSPERTDVSEEFSVTTAAIVDSGEIFVASSDTAEVSMYVNGERTENYVVGAPTDQLVSVPNDDADDAVVRIYRGDTTIQNLDWDDAREGGRLRVGVALGQMSVGNNGVILVSDTGGRRLAVYTSTDAVRLHQYGNVDGSPWAVAWDPQRNLAWVTATDNNSAQAFDISSGAPEPRGRFSTVANAQHMAITDSGAVVIGSASGDGVQIVTEPQLES